MFLPERPELFLRGISSFAPYPLIHLKPAGLSLQAAFFFAREPALRREVWVFAGRLEKTEAAFFEKCSAANRRLPISRC